MLLACSRLGEKDAVRVLFNEVAAKVAQIKSQDETIRWIRSEAAALLGVTDDAAPTPGKEVGTRRSTKP